MSLEFIKTHTATKRATIDFLQLHQVIRRTPPLCSVCGNTMTFVVRSATKAGFVWHCPNRRHGQRVSPLAGSFFEKSHLAPGKVLEILWCWSLGVPNKTAGK